MMLYNIITALNISSLTLNNISITPFNNIIMSINIIIWPLINCIVTPIYCIHLPSYNQIISSWNFIWHLGWLGGYVVVFILGKSWDWFWEWGWDLREYGEIWGCLSCCCAWTRARAWIWIWDGIGHRSILFIILID